jgi:hypothetical protein
MMKGCKNRIVENVSYGYKSHEILKSHSWTEFKDVGIICESCKLKNSKFKNLSDYGLN